VTSPVKFKLEKIRRGRKRRRKERRRRRRNKEEKAVYLRVLRKVGGDKCFPDCCGCSC